MMKTKEIAVLYQGISLSPEFSDLPASYGAIPSNLEKLLARRDDKLPDFIDQAELESVIRRQMNIS